MKEKKYKIELLSFYDHTGIENHLGEMAQKGWMIERISNYFWTYRKIRPQNLHFTVSYFSKASDFAPVPSEAQQTFFDFCSETGWKLACTWFQMQVFYNEAETPVPIHTEPALEVAAIHKACKKSYLRIYKVLFVVSLIATLLFLSSLVGDTLRILASPTDFMAGMVCFLLFLFTLMELGTYYVWYRKAKRQAGYGLFLDTPSTAGFQKGMFLILGLCLVYWLASLVFAGSTLMLWIILAILLCMAAISISIQTVKELLKRKRVPSRVNRTLTVIAGFVVSILLWNAVIKTGTQLFASMDPENLPLYEGAPLTVADLQKTQYSNYLTTVSSDESLFLWRLEVHQRHGFDDEPSPDIPELHYELYTVKVPALYRFCENQLKRLIVLSAYWDGKLVEQDAASWGAEKVYRLVLRDGTDANTYLLCYEDLLVWMEFNWEPTTAQMEMIQETFVPHI